MVEGGKEKLNIRNKVQGEEGEYAGTFSHPLVQVFGGLDLVSLQINLCPMRGCGDNDLKNFATCIFSGPGRLQHDP